jgi:hypothetical protein
MSASLHVPKAIKAKTTELLSEKILSLQQGENGKVGIISISQDLETKEWVCWYYPVRSLGGGLM